MTMHKPGADNVFWRTVFIGAIPLLATLGIVLNILFRDGPDVPTELNFLFGLVGAVVSIMTLLNAWDQWLWHKRKMADKDA